MMAPLDMKFTLVAGGGSETELTIDGRESESRSAAYL
jgi:hypothetical protein